MANPSGSLNPVAKVLTTPTGVTCSRAKEVGNVEVPAESKAKAVGLENPEAKVLTTPAGVTLLTVPSKLAT